MRIELIQIKDLEPHLAHGNYSMNACHYLKVIRMRGEPSGYGRSLNGSIIKCRSFLMLSPHITLLSVRRLSSAEVTFPDMYKEL